MKSRTAAVVVAICATAALTACGDDDPAPQGAQVPVTATDTSCEVATTLFNPGAVTFAVTNRGQQATGVYLYGRAGDGFTKVVAETAEVGPGKTGDLSATLATGTYEVACKPGRQGDGVRARITVSDDGTVASAAAETAYDREVAVELTADGITGVDGLIAEPGEKIQLKVANKTTGDRTLYVVKPDKKRAAEVKVAANGTAVAIVTLGGAGRWTLQVKGDGVPSVTKRLVVR
jgi:iron uptake system component EfeO